MAGSVGLELLGELVGADGGNAAALQLKEVCDPLEDLSLGMSLAGRIISTPPSGSPLAIPCHCPLSGSRLAGTHPEALPPTRLTLRDRQLVYPRQGGGKGASALSLCVRDNQSSSVQETRSVLSPPLRCASYSMVHGSMPVVAPGLVPDVTPRRPQEATPQV